MAKTKLKPIQPKITKIETPSYSWMIWTLGAIAFILFANTITHGFVLDDIAVIEQNKFVQKGFAGITDILITFYWQGFWNSNAGLYRPMSLIFFAIEWQLMPNTPFIHHLMNVILYALSIMLLFKVLLHFLVNYSIWISFFIVLLFAVHPIHTEVVANIKSRDEILCFLFFIISIYCFFLKKNKNYFILGCVSYSFCLLSKEAGILFLPIIIFLFWHTKKSKTKELLIASIPLLLITFSWLALHQYIINSSPFSKIQYTYLDNSLLSCEDKISQLATGISILGRYILKTIVPTNLSYDYSFNLIPCVGLDSFAFIGSVILVVSLLFTAYYFLKKEPLISFGIVFFFITICLVSNIVTLIGATMGDRLLYTPVLGILIALVFAIYYVLKAIQNTSFYHITSYIFIGIALVFSLTSFNRNKDWKSNFTLFTHDVTTAPNSARVHFNNATAYFGSLPENVEEQQSLLPNIITSYEKALSIDPNDKGSLLNLGVCYYRIKDYQKSIACSKKAFAIQPDVTIYGNLADAYFMSNDYDKAIANYDLSIKNKSVQYNTYNFLGVAWFNKKNYPKAIEVFQKGLQKQPDHAEMYLNYGNALAISSKIKEAIPVFEKAYSLNPKQKNALQFLAMCYAQVGDNEKAKMYLEQFKSSK